MKSVAVLQSNYIPWKGYFDIIHDVDLLVFYDDVQFTKNDWRNRNKIKAVGGTQWLTVPVGQSQDRLVCEVSIADRRWQTKHFKTLCQIYGKTPHFARYRPYLEHVYLAQTWDSLSTLNQTVIRELAREHLGIATAFTDSREWDAEGQKQVRLLDLLKKCGAQRYVSGPSARAYIEAEDFARGGIELVYKDYSGYPEYPQVHPPFNHQVSILDLLVQTGPDAPWFIWGWRESASPGVPPAATPPPSGR